MNKILTYTFLILVIGTSYSITNGFMNQKASADLCVGIIACSAIAGNGGRGVKRLLEMLEMGDCVML